MTAATKRMINAALLAAIAGSLFSTSFVSVFLLHRVEPGTTASLVSALLPLPFFIANFVVAFRLLRQCDEMQRRIQLEALAVAYPVVMIGVITLFMVRKAGFHVNFDLADLFMVMAFLYAVALFFSSRRYR